MTNDLWQTTLRHLKEGNFTSLQNDLGGPENFDRRIVDWFNAGAFTGETEMLAEALSCACMLGRTKIAEFLIDYGVGPYAGMKTGLAGPHYAVSGGHLETLKMLLGKNIDLEVENAYGGTLLGQALWSAVNENNESHSEIIRSLIEAGSHVWPGTLQWWNEQQIPNTETKRIVARMLEDHEKAEN